MKEFIKNIFYGSLIVLCFVLIIILKLYQNSSRNMPPFSFLNIVTVGSIFIIVPIVLILAKNGKNGEK